MNHRTMFDSTVRQLVENAHAPIPLEEGVTIALNGASQEDVTDGAWYVVDMVQSNCYLLTV